MLASSNTNQISSFPFMNQTTTFSIDDDDQNPMSRLLFEQQQSHQLIDCYNNYNLINNPFLDQDFILGHIFFSQKHQLLGNCNNNLNFFDIPQIGGVIQNSSQNKAKNDDDDDDPPPPSSLPKKPISRKKLSSSSSDQGGMKKKDRHSKICTSKGPRDRRMRLSLEIARNFFDLQDMLGFDKASKTVEWLFTKSRSAIKELKEKYLSQLLASNNCDIDSSSSDLLTRFSFCNDDDNKEVPSGKKRIRRSLRIVDKESRYKARARARERTRAKSMIPRRFETSSSSKTNFEGNPDEVCQMGDHEISSTKENEEIYLGSSSKGKNISASNLNSEDKIRVSKEICCDDDDDDHHLLLPDSSMDIWPPCPWTP